ncbi:glycosyltransferase [Sulfuriferula nivalis]|uniref:Glycosyltransferase n=1 Tax=Sulfuriferula nivalis TaxID=2675298 RepID=A0A809RPK1_9PROT|nr:glycosyltransferase [Sulfuriferula nivalis]BBP00761.1 hypothetical protein SFSGTM_14690 [Sulfuriferula nivalis]
MTSQLPTLAKLFAEHSGKVSDKWTIYISEYDRLFQPYRSQPVRLLEIGIQNGGSLEIWSKYFTKAAKFIGCDINPDCAQLQFDDPRITVVVADANTDETQQHILKLSPDFDLIIDDGSHQSGDIVRSFARYFTHLNDGGLYIAEDLHCSYWQDFEGGLFQPYSSIAFFKQLADTINHEHWGIDKTRTELLRSFNRQYNTRLDEASLAHIHSIEFINSMCVVRKAIPADNVLGQRFIAGSHALVWDGALQINSSSCTHPDQSANPWTAREMSIEEELTVRIQEITSLNQTMSERDGETADLIKTVLAQDQNVFQKTFDAVWYVKKYPDIDPAIVDPYQHYIHYGIMERRIPSADLAGFVRNGLLARLGELHAQSNQAKQQAEAQQRQLVEQEKTYTEHEQSLSQQLQAIHQELHHLEQARAQREQEFATQLLAIQQQADADKNELSQQYQTRIETIQRQQAEHEWLAAERIQLLNQQIHHLQTEQITREQTHTATLTALHRELTAQAQEQAQQQAQREQEFATQLLAIQQQADADKDELSQQYQTQIEANQRQQAEHEWLTVERIQILNQQLHHLQTEQITREQTHTATLTTLHRELTAQTQQQAQREQEFAAQLLTIQQQADADKDELSQQYQTQIEANQRQRAEHEQTLNTQLLAKQDELTQLSQRWLDAQQAYTQSVSQLEQQLQTMRTSYIWRWTAPLRSFAQLFIKSDASLQEDLHDSNDMVPHTLSLMQDGTVINPLQSSPQVDIHEQLTMNNSAPTSGSNMSANRTPRIAQSIVELLSYYDEEFVHYAYQTLLGRAPDAEGLRYYLARVRSGVSKVEILTQLRLGTEGKSRQLKITGLDKAIRRHKQLKTPLLGSLLRVSGVSELGNADQSLRAVENKLYALNIQIRQGLSEVSRSLNRLQQIEIPCEDVMKETKNLVPDLDDDSIFTYPTEMNSKPYDPINDRYHATLSEISSRLRTPDSGTSNRSMEKVKISILMPVYKVPLPFLTKAIESVQYQTYTNWELCIVDDGSNDINLTKYLNEVAHKDSRIKLEIASNNRGIASATNAAISMSTGEFIALLDNDDMLTNDALYWIASEIQSYPDVDYIYSDECKMDEHDVPVELFTKPDWSPIALFNCMYTGHLSIYRKKVLEQAGLMRSAYDFSQDYDLALRVSELTNNVRHIARILYGWRMIAGSGAQGDKPYARATNIAALQNATERRGFSGEAVAEPSANHFRAAPVCMEQMVSIVIPSDNLKNIQNTVNSIKENTIYNNFEIIVVTNSGIVNSCRKVDWSSDVLWVSYDKEFNFSEKCNVGAEQASGDIIVFYNDDVRVVSKNWIEMILECFIHTNVGIVGPKLLYENYLIQHAGMVTGVRGLVGTAFHCLPHETSKHFNAALSLREVSLICGACLAIKRNVFNIINGFDAVNAPISHSDVDLCFRVREAGYACLYTPHATLIHIGHMSIGEAEKKSKPIIQKKDKSDIFLLRQWGKYTSYDPYFPPAMRDILYHDSPELWQLHANVPPAPAGGKDVLLISHDLSGSGAPRIVFEMARVLRDAGHFVVVASPEDGVFREQLNALGVPVIIDELLLRRHASLEKLAINFDLVIANTAVTWPAVKQLGGIVDTFWYIHEISLLQHLFNIQPEIKEAFQHAKKVWVGSDHAAALTIPYRPDTVILKYGVNPLYTAENELPAIRLPLRVSLFGSYEQRKGQDIAIAAFATLPPEYRNKLRLNLFGRILDENLYQMVALSSRDLHEVTLKTEIPYERYIEELLASHVVLVASRDDTLPFVSIDALGAGKVLMCTNTTGTSSYIEHGVSGFVSSSPEPYAIALVLREAIDRMSELDAIALNGRKVFDLEFSVSAFTAAFFNACDIN